MPFNVRSSLTLAERHPQWAADCQAALVEEYIDGRIDEKELEERLDGLFGLERINE